MSLEKEILLLAEKHFDEILRIRRDIHANPEVGFDVKRTSGIASAEMKKLNLKVREGLGRTGLIADLIVDPSFPLVALRADMDALPMQEEASPTYKSRIDGAAHMCGHDAHTAMLIGAARILSQMKSHLKQNVRFLFQPNEESLPGGAPEMIQDGALEGVKEIFALHVWPLVETGKIGTLEGSITAQPDVFDIVIQGRGGHAAAPQLSIDPIVVGAHFVSQLQSIVSRRVDPLQRAVVSVTQFHAGTTHNVIPADVRIQGTVRTFDKSIQAFIRVELEKVLKACCDSADATYELNYVEGYPSTLNAASATQNVVKAATRLLGESRLEYPVMATMGGEDFAYYSHKIPACFYFLGIRNIEKGITRMCHDPRFDIDEDVLSVGMAIHAAIALQL